jgi:uncharacterized protein (DUF1015 family)
MTSKVLLRAFVCIKPFRGFLPPVALAPRLVVPPYDVIESEEARAEARANDLSFFYCSKPEVTFGPETDQYDDKVYQQGKANLLRYLALGRLEPDLMARMYIYEMQAVIQGESRSLTGIIGCTAVKDYLANNVKRHELTRHQKELDRTQLTDAQSANMGSVCQAYKPRKDIEGIIDNVKAERAHYDFNTKDGHRHLLWKCSQLTSLDLQQRFDSVSSVYIIDGHHRAAAAVNVQRRRRQRAEEAGVEWEDSGADYYMSINFSTDQLKILPYNRLVRDLNGLTQAQFMKAVEEKYEVVPETSYKPRGRGFVNLYLGGSWFGLKVRAEMLKGKDLVGRLDVQLLTDLILSPVLGIRDLRKTERIEFIGGATGGESIPAQCNNGFVAGFSLHPIDIDDVVKTADSNSILPPKSTWFEPKPKSGLVVNIF